MTNSPPTINAGNAIPQGAAPFAGGIQITYELTSTVRDIAPEELWVTHGREDALVRWAELEGVAAKPLSLIGYEDENE